MKNEKEYDTIIKMQLAIIIITVLALFVQMIMSMYNMQEGFLLASWFVGIFVGTGLGIIMSKRVLL